MNFKERFILKLYEIYYSIVELGAVITVMKYVALIYFVITPIREKNYSLLPIILLMLLVSIYYDIRNRLKSRVAIIEKGSICFTKTHRDVIFMEDDGYWDVETHYDTIHIQKAIASSIALIEMVTYDNSLKNAFNPKHTFSDHIDFKMSSKKMVIFANEFFLELNKYNIKKLDLSDLKLIMLYGNCIYHDSIIGNLTIEEISLPKTLKYLGSNFHDCPSLKRIYLYCDDPPKLLYKSIFECPEELTFIVKDQITLNRYLNDDAWSNFTYIIDENTINQKVVPVRFDVMTKHRKT